MTIGALKKLGQVTLGTSNTDIVVAETFQPSSQTIVHAIWISNNDTVDREVTLREGAGSLTDANNLGKAWVIKTGKTLLIDSQGNPAGILVIQSGSKLAGLADAASVVVVTAYGEVLTS